MHFTELIGRVPDGQWLGWTSQGHEMYCHDMEIMGLNHGRVEHGMRCTCTSV